MMVVGNINNGSQIVPGLIFSISRGRRLMEYFSTDRKPFRDIPLDKPTCKPIVFIIRARIEPVTTASVSRPGSLALLKPDRKEELGVTISQAPVLVSRGQMEYRKGSHHRSIIALLDKTVFHSEFEIAETIECWPSSWFVEDGGGKEVELYVWRYPIVQLQVGSSARYAILVIRVLGRDIEFPVAVIYRFGVVCPERRAGKERKYGKKSTEKYTDGHHEQANACCSSQP